MLEYSPPISTKIFSADGDLIEEYALEHRSIVDFDKIPLAIKGAFLIAEDRDFYTHSGISMKSLFRAVVENTAKKSWAKKPAGGSTITQQIAKNLLIGNKRSLTRKIKEAIMAFRIESTIPKDKILEIYLNQLYLGKGCYGISEATEYYFGKELSKISHEEAAFLAAIPSAPSVYINVINSSKLLTKRNSILYQMYEFGYISKEELKTAISKPIAIKFRKNKIFSPYFSDEIFRIFTQKISTEHFFKKGYQITTTMNKKIQLILTKTLEDGLIDYTKSQKWNGTLLGEQNNTENYKLILNEINRKLPSTINKICACLILEINKEYLLCKTENGEKIKVKTNQYKNEKFSKGDVILCRNLEKPNEYEAYQQPEVTGGAIIMEAKTGEVLGMTGGYSFDISAFNCITQAKRQPGSTIKPFIYAAALEQGMDENDIIEDKPISITLLDGKKYSPRNYTKKCYGKTPMRDGLIHSRNLSTINLALLIGTKSISKLLMNAGLAEKKIPISGVLGAVETLPINIVSAFSAFVNQGEMVYPKFIKNIDQTPCKTDRHRICSKETAETIKGILIDCVKLGTAVRAAPIAEKYEMEIGGKTGTTNDFKDAWFVGYFVHNEKTYIMCVFVGYKIPKTLGQRFSGAKVALPVFASFIEKFAESNL
ncbi:penicillin-binding protein 1A [Alphaproteobacteria bacterium]|nr:penicillin-binding protein 1A [Alphaproteobacteria bacterium]